MTSHQKYEKLLKSIPRTHYVYISKQVISTGARKEIKREVRSDQDGDPMFSVARKSAQSSMSRHGYFPHESFSAQDKLRQKLQTGVSVENEPEKKTKGRKKAQADEDVQGI